jgi:hypothetical protein
MTAYLFAQGWNNTVTTTISEPNFVKMDLFSNKDGNHIIVQNSNSVNSIKYYLLNSSGSVVRSSTIETSGYAEFPNISGDNDKVYLVYKLGNNIKAKYSTNAGVSWNNVQQNISVSSNTCNGVDIVYGDGGVHVVYAMRDNYEDYETYYYKLNSSNSWVDYKNVTDYGSEVGGVPSITVSNNRVHVSYNTGQANPPSFGVGVSKTRDKNGTNWETPQLVSDGEVQYGTSREKLQVRNNSLFNVFFDTWVDLGQFGCYIQVKARDLTATVWPGSYSTLFINGHPNVGIGAETTNNGNLHVINHGLSNGIQYRYFNGSSWSSEQIISSDFLYNPDENNIGFSSSSNDLYVSWKAYNNNYIKYRQYDAAPLAPSNLAISINSSDETVLTWNANTEPDVRITNGKYKIYRAETDLNGNILPYQLAATINAINGTTPVTSWIDPDAMKSTVRKLYYKITAMDINQHESLFSNVVWRFGRLGKTTSQNISNSEYELFDNYPNPFNPSTKITYSIKEEGLVTLKVYDVLGKEIATLVNENKPAGNYEAEFNASQLPSGMYIYKIQSGQFSDVKKMLLTK